MVSQKYKKARVRNKVKYPSFRTLKCRTTSVSFQDIDVIAAELIKNVF